MNTKPALLLQQTRSNLTEQEYYGYIILCNADKNIQKIGIDYDYPYFHRSAAKPLQASVLKDFKTDEYYDMSAREIAVCCASHTGEQVHIDILRNLLKKGGICETDLKCPAIEPLDKSEQIKFAGKYTPLHNNCSGKHTLMLLICRQMGWDIATYLDRDHPLQIAVYKKIQQLCEAPKELPFTFDGCGAPNFATSLSELAKGFYNVFCTDDYRGIRNAFLSHPYLIGGNHRPDTEIMQLGNHICAKAGAGGIMCIANTLSSHVLVIKLMEADMQARSIVAVDAMIKLGWVDDINSTDCTLLYNKIVTTENKKPIGEYKSLFDIKDFVY